MMFVWFYEISQIIYIIYLEYRMMFKLCFFDEFKIFPSIIIFYLIINEIVYFILFTDFSNIGKYH
jgi:hypothetical protein